MGDGVEEGVLTLVAANLADEEDGVEDDAGDEGSEEEDAEDGEGDGALVEEEPGALRDGEADEDRAEGDEEGDGSAAACDVHSGQECISGGAALSISRSYGECDVLR